MRHETRCLQAGVLLLLVGQLFAFAQKAEETAEPAVKEKAKPEEHGMQYRAIGPFRGGRSLTAAGIPGDPTTYYFGSTGGGIWKSTDGGTTWTKVLYVDDNTGGIDVVFDPHNPNILFASMWQVRRTPWNLSSGGPGSGLYRSDDGGTTWKRVEHEGLPKGP